MSDRDGCWESDWDPEVGIDPPDDDAFSQEPTADEMLLEYAKWLSKWRYEIHRGSSHVLMEGGQWEPIKKEMSGKFQTEHKWLAKALAEKFNATVVEAARELTDDELQRLAYSRAESVEDL